MALFSVKERNRAELIFGKEMANKLLDAVEKVDSEPVKKVAVGKVSAAPPRKRPPKKGG